MKSSPCKVFVLFWLAVMLAAMMFMLRITRSNACTIHENHAFYPYVSEKNIYFIHMVV
jgi:hypothetical protein